MGTNQKSPVQMGSCAPSDCALLISLLEATKLFDESVDSEDAFKEKILHDPDSIVVLKKGGVLIGMVMIIFDPWASSLWHLAVHPEYQRQGFGRALAREAEKRLITRGAMSVVGYVRRDNEPSLSMFRGRGWKDYPEMDIIPIEKKF